MDPEIYRRYKARRNAKETPEQRAARKEKSREYNRKRNLRFQAAKPPKIKKSKEQRLNEKRENARIYMRNKRTAARAGKPPRPPAMTRAEIEQRYRDKRKATETLAQREERLRVHKEKEAVRRKRRYDAMTQEEREADRLTTNKRLKDYYAKKTVEDRKARKRTKPMPEKAKEYSAKWKAKNPEHAKAIFRKNSHKRRALKSINTSLDMITEAGRMMKFILASPASACAYCDKLVSGKEREIDHIKPLSRGGSHSPMNLIACCRSCNAKKWRNSIGKTFQPANGKIENDVLFDARSVYRAWKSRDREVENLVSDS